MGRAVRVLIYNVFLLSSPLNPDVSRNSTAVDLMSTLLPVLSLCQKCLPFSLPPLIILSSMQLTFLIYHVLVPSLSPCSRTSKQAQPNHLVRIFVQTTLYTTEFSQTPSSPGTNIRSQPFLQDPASACAPLPLRVFSPLKDEILLSPWLSYFL